MKPWLNMIWVVLAAIGGYMAANKNINNNSPAPAPEIVAADFGEIINDATLVDLTHRMEEGMPQGPSGNEPPTIKPLKSYDDGTAGIHRYNFPGQWGTHVDPPVHFVKGLRTLEDIPLTEMILPLIVIDVHEKVAANNDYQVSITDIYEWEEKHEVFRPASAKRCLHCRDLGSPQRRQRISGTCFCYYSEKISI